MNLENNNLENLKEKAQLKEQMELLEVEMKNYLSKEALSRYGNLKSAYPEKALQVVVLMSQIIQSGHLNQRINDLDFKRLLTELDKNKKDFKFVK